MCIRDSGRLERKSDMFTKRTIQPHRPVEHTDTAVEALAVSMNERARVDMEYMSRLCGKDEATIAAELNGCLLYTSITYARQAKQHCHAW